MYDSSNEYVKPIIDVIIHQDAACENWSLFRMDNLRIHEVCDTQFIVFKYFKLFCNPKKMKNC